MIEQPAKPSSEPAVPNDNGSWSAGDCYKENDEDYWRAGIDQNGHPRNISSNGVWGSRIECYGQTEQEAIDLRDKVLAAIHAAEKRVS